MTAETVFVNVRAVATFRYTELDEDRAPEKMDWQEFLWLVEDGTITPTVEVEVIRELKAR